MAAFQADATGLLVATCRDCGLTLYRRKNGTIGGAALLVECRIMQAINRQALRLERRMATEPE